MKLALFFTRNVSLRLWVDSGLFDREKLIYQEHLHKGNLQKVYWLTYGKDDGAIAEQLKSEGHLHQDIVLLPMPRLFYGPFGRLLYSFLMPLIYYRLLRSADILKTNQTDGSWSGVITKWLYKKPLIARSGYTLSRFARKKAGAKLKVRLAECIERLACNYADITVVAGSRDKQYICSKYSVPPEKVKVMHNYVDTGIFYPMSCKKYSDRMIFVGRLEQQKNLSALIEAVSTTDFILDIYGKGRLHEQLKRNAKELNAQVSFMGVMPNEKMPEVLNSYTYYILPSLYEGMPKSLLEAMACGLICIGTNVEGTNEIIEDGVNGYMAKGTDAPMLAEAINRAIRLPADSICARAIQTIRDEFAVEAIVEQETELFESLKS